MGHRRPPQDLASRIQRREGLTLQIGHTKGRQRRGIIGVARSMHGREELVERARASIAEHGEMDGANLLDWPITLDDLEPYYDKAEDRMGVRGSPLGGQAVNFSPVTWLYQL